MFKVKKNKSVPSLNYYSDNLTVAV